MGRDERENTLKRLMWLLRTIYQASPGGIKRKQISQKWIKNTELSTGEEYPEKTFHNHREDIKNIFKIPIQRKGHKYYIDLKDNMELTALATWMDYMDIKDAVAENANLRERIFWGTVPGGSQWIRPILNAMQNSVEIVIKYSRSKKSNNYTVQPYFLRMYRQRWYLIGGCLKLGGIYIFSLGLISAEATTVTTFRKRIVDMASFSDDAKFLERLNAQNKK